MRFDPDEMVRRRRAGQRVDVGAAVRLEHMRMKREMSGVIAVGVPVNAFDVAGDFGARREFGDPIVSSGPQPAAAPQKRSKFRRRNRK